MKLFIVGTSCTWFTRNNTSFIIDDNTLVDMPEGSYKDIIKQIDDIFKIKTIFITHFHADHFNDLRILITRYMRELKSNREEDRLKIYGPKGLFEQVLALNKLVFGGADETDPMELRKNVDFFEVKDGDVVQLKDYKVEVFEMNHGNVYSQGYSFTDNSGKVVSFTGDTAQCDNLDKMLNISDFAFVDMATINRKNSHLSAAEFVNLSKKYTNCKMFPVHTSDESQKFAEKNNLNYVVDGETLHL